MRLATDEKSWARAAAFLASIFCIILIFTFVQSADSLLAASAIVSAAMVLSYVGVFYGLCLFMISLPVYQLPSVLGSNLAPAEAVLLSVLAVFFAKASWRGRLSYNKTPLDKPLAALCLVVFFSLIRAFLAYGVPKAEDIQFTSALFVWRSSLLILESVAAYYLIVNQGGGGRGRTLVFCLLAGAFISGLFGLAQWFVIQMPRPTSFFDSSNSFAMFLAMVLPLSVWTSLNSRNKAVYAIIPLVLFAALWVTYCRGALLGLGLAVLAYVFFVRRKRVLAQAFVIVSIISFVFLAYVFSESPYLVEEVSVDSEGWRQVSFDVAPSSNPYYLRVWFPNPYLNISTGEKRELYVANITDALVVPRILDKYECTTFCPLYAHYYVQTRVNGSFSMMVSGRYGRGWPSALVILEEDTLSRGIRESLPLRGMVELRGSFDSRLKLWSEAVSKAALKPLTGYGYVYLDKRLDDYSDKPIEHAHNTVLQWVLQWGLVGAFVMVWLFYSFFKGVHASSGLAAAIALGVVAYLGHGLVDYSLKANLLLFALFALSQTRGKQAASSYVTE